MGAARFVGRVRGLAVALGAGAGLGLALYAGSGVALADSTDAADARDRAAGAVQHHRKPAGVASPRPAAAARHRTARSTAAATAAVTDNGITVNPTVDLVDGVIQGNLQATSSRGLPLTLTALGGANGGKLNIGNVNAVPQSFTALPYATWLDTGTKGAETFTVRVSEVTGVDQFLVSLPVVGLVAQPVINLLQQLPLISDLLAPIIGASMLAAVDVNVAALAPGSTPVAFTYKLTSFDGTRISTNFFPAAGLAAGDTAPTVLDGPGLGDPGATNPYELEGTEGTTPDVGSMRRAGFNVITWDPRGEYASGGIMQLDNPFYEGRDASAIITWATANTPAVTDPSGDPKVGMVGGSYGGGIQLVTAATDPRVDAITPAITWNSLITSLYPDATFKSAWGNILMLYLLAAGATINNQIYKGIFTGDVFGWLSQTSQAMLSSSGSTALLEQVKVPTLLVQGTMDALFPPDEAVANAQAILANPFGAPVKMMWVCDGHGACLDPVNPGQQQQIYDDTIAWLDQYVAGDGTPADAVPVFQWYDQKGDHYTSDLLPFQAGFNQADPYTVSGDGGVLGILPLIGGSGPLPDVSWPAGWIFGTPASNAINVAAAPAVGSQIVGNPQLSFTYQGLGTSRAVYAQLVDDVTGRVLGTLVSPIPVTLDGQQHTVSIAMDDVAYTVGTGDSLTLQITSSATVFANSSLGVIDISGVQLDLPLRAVSG